MTNTSQTRHAIIDEVTPGTTPATPAFQLIRLTGGGMTEKSQYVSSNEIRPDRNVGDSTLVARNVDGDFPFELSYGSFDSLLEKFLCSTWSSNVIKNGVLDNTFTYEATDEMGVTDDYERYTGCRVNTLSLDMKAQALVTGSFGVIGSQLAIGTAPLTGATYTPASTTPVISASNDFGSLIVNDVAGPAIMDMQLNGTNNLNLRPVVGSVYTNGLRKGQFQFTGTMNVYFDAATLRDVQRANTLIDISLRLGGTSSQKYDILLPKVRLTGAEKVRGGNNDDVMLNVGFQAIYDASNAASIKITRTP